MSPLNSFFNYTTLLGKRFYRNFTNNSPSSKPGFMLLESVQKLSEAAKRRAARTSEISSVIPENLQELFKNYDEKKALPSLKGSLHPSDIDRLVSAHPNQTKPDPLRLLNLTRPLQLLPNIFSPTNLKSLAESLQEQFDTEAVECANVLKKRRRRMRGHKHKKRLKERRHKADK